MLPALKVVRLGGVSMEKKSLHLCWDLNTALQPRC